MSEFKPKSRDHSVNVSSGHPLKDFAKLVLVAVGLVAVMSLVFFFVGDHIAALITPEQEIRWVKKVWVGEVDAFVCVEAGIELSSDKELNTLFNELWRPYSSSEELKLKIGVLDQPIENAFMTVGGHSYVTKKLLLSSESENALSFVLCHEIAHFYHRDVIRRIGAGVALLFVQGTMGLTGVDMEFYGSLSQMFHSKYSRDQESRADAFALDCLNKRYGHVDHHDEFFSHMEKTKGELELPSELSYLQSHPSGKDRILALKAIIAEKGYKATGRTTPNPFASPKTQ